MGRNFCRNVLGAGLLLQIAFTFCASAASNAEIGLVRNVMEEYRKAWLANDQEAVMKTLSRDAVLMPPHSAPAVVGEAPIRAYWWPSGSPFTIDEFDQPLLEAYADGSLGYVRGTSRVAWTNDPNGKKEKKESTSTFLAILKKKNGEWRITHLMWEAP